MIDPAIHVLARFSLALLMVSAARHKLIDLAAFRDTVTRYRILPQGLGAALANALPFVEIALAAMLVSGTILALAGAALVSLLLIYAAAIAVNVRRGRIDLDCGCMGPAYATPVSGTLVARNLLLAAVALVVMLPVSERSFAPLDVAGIFGSTVVLAACWSATARMLALEPRVAAMRAQRRRAQ